jgi:hypothetical protein
MEIDRFDYWITLAEQRVRQVSSDFSAVQSRRPKAFVRPASALLGASGLKVFAQRTWEAAMAKNDPIILQRILLIGSNEPKTWAQPIRGCTIALSSF